MAAAGGFGDDYTGPTAEMSYWRLRGGAEPGAVVTPIEATGEIAALISQSEDSLRAPRSRPSTILRSPISRAPIPAARRGTPPMAASPAWPNGPGGGDEG